MKTTELLGKVLNGLRNIGGIEAAAAVSRDGLVMKTNMPSSQKPETFAAMSATMIGAAETATTELGKGIPERVIVETKSGKIIAVGAGQKTLLLIITTPDVGLGLVLIETEKAAKKIKELLG